MKQNEYLKKFFEIFPMEALTFDDVSLVTQYADFLPDDAVLETRLTRDLKMKTPFISAAMDTVTEWRMAVAMAMMGGIGIIHKNLSLQEQAHQVGKVKHYLNGRIHTPISVRETDTIESILQKRKEKAWNFHSFPVLDKNGKLVGILTGDDFDTCTDNSLKAADVMTKELITAKPDTTLQQAYGLMTRSKKKTLPLVDGNGKVVGMYIFSDVKRIVTGSSAMYNVDGNNQLRVGAAVGVGRYAIKRLEQLLEEGLDVAVIDTAHGHSKGVIDTLRMIQNLRKKYDFEVIAGNVATYDGAKALVEAGAGAVKIGVGPGSICTTRVVCGVGIPQLTAVYNAKQGAGDVPVIADGGIRYSGDVVKAIAAGADSVMMGSILAGTEESPGEKTIIHGRQYVSYRGMGSLGAMQQNKGSRERYEQSKADEDKLVPQGVEGVVPYSGLVRKVLTQFIGGLRSGMGYCGARTIHELQETGKFVRVSAAGKDEGHPHDVEIMKEPPNYRR